MNSSSGGNVGINGSISDSSGQGINWTLNVLDQTFTGTGTSVNAIWNGKNADGTVVEPGSYSATLTAQQTADGQCKDSKTINFTVTPAPEGQCGLYVKFGSSAHMASGNLSHSQDLFSSKGGALPAGLSLYYNSLDPHNGSLGRGWSHSYDISLQQNSDGSVLISEPNWKYQYFTPNGGTYTASPGNYSTLAKNADGTFTLTAKDGQVYAFAANGTLTSSTDRNGNTTAFTYSGGNLAGVTDPSGRAVTFAYDNANHLTAITDPSGNVYNLSVGTALNSVTQPDGGTWQYSYDANAYMLTKTDPLGNTTTYAYDADHRATSATDPEGKTRSVAYPQTSDTARSTTFTEKDGGQWSYTYDTQAGTLTKKTDPQGGVTSYTYDASGNRLSTTNPDATTTSATYDNRGNMLTATDALGQTTGYTYNGFGQVTAITDPQGGTTAYAYDARGNMTSLTDATGAVTTYAYDTRGNVTAITAPLGRATTFTYDQAGNLATVTDSVGATTSYGYDASGNVTTITDPKGGITKFVYDARNHLIKSIDPQGNTTTYTYDLSGNKLSETDANGNTTTYSYNAQNQLIRTTGALGNVTTYAYGGSACPSCGGNGEKLTSLADADNNITSYDYDQLGRLVKETDPKGNTTTYAYDARNNLTSKTDATGATISYSYDATNRLLRKTYPDATEEGYTYDPKGNILTATNRDIAYTFSYDAAGRMLTATDSNGKVLQYSYDTTGRKTRTTYPEGSIVNYAYDGTGRLTTITSGGGAYNYTYDKLGRRTKLTHPNGTTASYTYDSAGRLTNLTHTQANGRTIASFAYTLDKVGNRLTRTEPTVQYTYGYDQLYQLLQAVPTKLHQKGEDREGEYRDRKTWTEQYSYDPTGNRLTGPRVQAAYLYGPGNQLLTGPHVAYTYDKNGNQIAKTVQSRDGDEREATRNWTYTYDFENRLIKAETKHDDETIIVSFKYDPLGRRIEKKVETSENGKPEESKVYTYVYDGQNIVLEYLTKTEDGETKTEATNYVHGPGIDEPLSIQQKGEVYYYHADGLGSIVALTDKRQKVVESYEYDSFGNMKRHGDKVKNTFTYTGREWDKETGLYYYRARYYDPMEGRFISKDPLLSTMSSLGTSISTCTNNKINMLLSLHPYSYVDNNPIVRTDPEGLFWALDCIKCFYYMNQCAKEGLKCKKDKCQQNDLPPTSDELFNDCYKGIPSCQRQLEYCGKCALSAQGSPTKGGQ